MGWLTHVSRVFVVGDDFFVIVTGTDNGWNCTLKSDSRGRTGRRLD
jgi:hypothetical protein